MKKILCIIIVNIMTIFSISAEDNFYIIKLYGNINNNTNSEKLIQGGVINSSATLKVTDKKASAVLVNEEGEIFMLKIPEQLSYNENHEIIVDFAKCITLITGFEEEAKRGFKKVEIKKDINDLKKYFGENKFAVLGDTLSVKLDESVYPLNNDKFIVFYYKINNVQVSKKVGFENHYLKIEKSKLFSSNNQIQKGDILKSIFVYQYERSTEKAELLTKINLEFISTANLEKEFNVILKAVNKQNFEPINKKKLLINYFTDVYGVCCEKKISEFINSIEIK